MKTQTLIRSLAFAAALYGMSLHAAPEHSTPANNQSPAPQVLDSQLSPSPTNSPTEVEPAAPPGHATPPQPESQIIIETRLYEASLRDLAHKAEQIVQRMPDRPDELARNFGQLRDVLIVARTNLAGILARKAEIDKQAEAVLQSAADVRQAFMDLTKKIDARLQQIRERQTDNPKGVEAAANALAGIKSACERGQHAVAPLRQLVLETHRQGEAIFAELELYPEIFDYAVEACELYQRGIGEPASYAAVVEGLTKARANLRAIIESFIQAAQKAEETIKKIPQPMTGLPIS